MRTMSSIRGAACSGSVPAGSAGPSASSASGSALPSIDKRPRRAINRIASRQRHLADVAQRFLTLSCGGFSHVGALPDGIGADHGKVGARPLVLVRYSGGDHDHIAGAQLE